MDANPNGTLDPRTAANDASLTLAALYAVYDRLIGFDEKGKPVPQLATSWTFSDDLKTLTLKLRDGVTFHDGSAFDSAAAKANLEAAMKLADDVGPTVKAAAAEIASVETPGPLELAIQLKQADGGFAYNLGGQLGMMISPTALAGRGLKLDPVGAGPYKVAKFTPNQTTELVRNDDYWDGAGDRPKHLVMKYVTDENTRLNAVRSGEVTVSLLNPQQVSSAQGAGLEVKTNPSSSVWTIYLNTAKALKDPLVREALMYAVDRKSIAKALSFGTAEPYAQLIPKGQPGYVEGIEDDYPYNPQKAKQLLAQAGYPDGLKLSMLALSLSDYTQILDVLTQQLQEVGITLDVQTYDVSQAIGSYLDGCCDLFPARWAGRSDPLKTLQVVIGQGGTYAPAGPVSQELQDAIDKTSSYSLEDPARTDALQAANELAVKQAATIPIMGRAFIYAYKKGCISGLDPYLASGANDWRNVVVGTGC